MYGKAGGVAGAPNEEEAREGTCCCCSRTGLGWREDGT